MPQLNRAQILCLIIFVSLTLVHAHDCNAQFTDSFTDGDFTSNPTWAEVVSESWVVANGRLKSNLTIPSSTFYITTPSETAVDAQWEFWVNLQFNTSSTNYVDVYLVSANQNLNAAGNNGYFVRIGGTADEISFYKITGGSPSVLINGTDGVTNKADNILKIKVIRDVNSGWTLSYDNTGTGNNFVSEQSVADDTFITSSFFGIRVTQSTPSFHMRHLFDDFYVGDIIRDTDPPAIISATPGSATELDVLFSEKVTAATAEQEPNYSVNYGVGQPANAQRLPDGKTVRLSFLQPFANGVTSRLSVSNVEDEFGNALSTATADFFFFQEVPAVFKDVIITEIFPDPAPIIGLPEAEFIELYNRSNKIINLAGWKFTDGSSTAILSGMLQPGEYKIITANASVALFTPFGSTTGVANFPTLNNSSDNLELQRSDNVLVDKVSYSDTWYKDDDKKQGGYTLELIDPANPCGEDDNWTASESAAGGTPGKQNSVFENKPDLTGPQLRSAVPLSETSIVLKFNEKLKAGEPAVTNFTLTPEIQLQSVAFTDASLTAVTLTLTQALTARVLYTLTVRNVYDCNGNEIQAGFSTAEFALPEPAAENDLVLNEVLFNPRPTGIDFVEIYNNSDKYINLKTCQLANYENGQLLNAKPITGQDVLLKPYAYGVFSVNKNIVKGEYLLAVENNLLDVASLPSMNDDQGTIAIANGNTVVDFFAYSDDYHSQFLKNTEGVSLERISVSARTNDASNWQSASASAGFATPGYANSNARGEILSDQVTVDPEIFEPLSGQPAFTQIHYNFSSGGYVANVKILDAQGREVKQLANNSTLGTSGFFRWDGDMNNGSKARTGYYIVWIEIFNTSGRVDSFRKRVIIASRF